MNNVQSLKRSELRQKLLNLSWEIVKEHGGGALRMRDLAKGCECSVGTVYNIFEGIQEIILRLNVRSIHLLTGEIMTALESETDLRNGVRAMGNAYLEFAISHPHQWKTLFERESIQDPPDWYLKEVNGDLEKIQKELVFRFELDKISAAKLAGFFWAAIHGITSIMLHKKTRIVENIIREEDIDRYIDHCLMGMIP